MPRPRAGTEIVYTVPMGQPVSQEQSRVAPAPDMNGTTTPVKEITETKIDWKQELLFSGMTALVTATVTVVGTYFVAKYILGHREYKPG